MIEGANQAAYGQLGMFLLPCHGVSSLCLAPERTCQQSLLLGYQGVPTSSSDLIRALTAAQVQGQPHPEGHDRVLLCV